MIDKIQPKGSVEIVLQFRDFTKKIQFHNTVLLTGREALAASLANNIGSSYDFFINRMLFGDGGTSGGVPKHVGTERNGLFGITRAVKPVLATIDPNLPSRVIFTTVLSSEEANGYALNEIALQMNNGNLYSMATFADLNKTSAMSITFNWSLSFV
jgi:hypothetical protein